MGISFTDYLSMLGTALAEQQGPNIAYLLRPTTSYGKDIVKEFRGNPTVSIASSLKVWRTQRSLNIETNAFCI